MRKIYFILADKLRISPIDADQLDFYWIEYLIEDLDDKIKEENKQHKKQEDDYKKQSSSQQHSHKSPNIGNTNYGGFQTPKIAIPKISIPRM